FSTTCSMSVPKRWLLRLKNAVRFRANSTKGPIGGYSSQTQMMTTTRFDSLNILLVSAPTIGQRFGLRAHADGSMTAIRPGFVFGSCFRAFSKVDLTVSGDRTVSSDFVLNSQHNTL